MSYPPSYTFTPVIHAFPGPVGKSNAEKIASAEQNSLALYNQFVKLTAQVQEAEKEHSVGVNFPETAKKLVELKQKLAAVDKRWGESQTLVNTLHQELDKANEDRREWNRDQQQQVAAAAAAKAEAIDADRREKIGKARSEYNKQLQEYYDLKNKIELASPWKTQAKWMASYVPVANRLVKPTVPESEWELNDDDDPNEISRKKWLIYDAMSTLSGGKSKRRTKKGKGKNARPCRRSTCRRSTRRH
jgi:hypothetical protein